MKEGVIKYFYDLLEYVKYYNNHSPFPVFDTEYVDTIEKHIKEMEDNKDYDKLPVVACKHCKSLHIITDEEDNDVCMRCGSINEISFYENIDVYFEKTHPNEKC